MRHCSCFFWVEPYENGCLNSIWTRLAIREGGPRIWHFTGSGFVCIPEQAIHSIKIFWISDFHGLSRFFHAHGCFVHWLEELYDVFSFGGSVGWLVINDVYFGGIYLSSLNFRSWKWYVVKTKLSDIFVTITIWLFSHFKGSDYITRLDFVQDRSCVTMCMTSSIYEFIETGMRLCNLGKLVSFSTTDGILLNIFTNHLCTQRLLQVWLWLPSVHLSFLGSWAFLYIFFKAW